MCVGVLKEDLDLSMRIVLFIVRVRLTSCTGSVAIVGLDKNGCVSITQLYES